MRRRFTRIGSRYPGLRGEPVEHYIEIGDLAASASKHLEDAVLAAGHVEPKPDQCTAGMRHLVAGVSKLAMARCLADESDPGRLQTAQRAEVEEIHTFVPPVSLDAIILGARRAKQVVEACYDRVGAVATYVPPPREPVRPLPEPEGGLIEF